MKIRRRKDGYYTTQIRTPEGKYKSVYGKTKTEVSQKAHKLITSIETGGYVSSSKMLVEAWTETWLSNYLLNVKESTRISYKQYVYTHINPFFKGKKLQDVTTSDCQRFVKYLVEQSGLSPTTIRTLLTVYKRCLNDAVKDGLLAQNPARNVVLPRIEEEATHALTAIECSELLEYAYSHSNYGDAIEFLLLTGLRINELRGLMPEDYNPKEKSLTISRQVGKTGKLTSTKSGKPRKIYLVNKASDIIENRINQGKTMIFSGVRSEFISYTSIRVSLKEAARSINHEELRVHDLRHTYATLSLQAGMDIKTLQENLGHYDPGFTLRKYGHSTDEMKRLGNEKLENLLKEI